MKKRLLSLALFNFSFLIFNSPASAQITFEKTFGAGTGRSVQQTKDGGFIITGDSSVSATSSYAFLMKTDAYGNTTWKKTYGTGGQFDKYYGTSVQQTKEGGFIVGGDFYFALGGGFGANANLIKTDANGDTVWTKIYTSMSVSCVQQTFDNGFIIVGSRLIKTDANGDTLWTKPYSGNSVQQTKDSGFVIVGSINKGNNNYDISLIKTNSKGDTAWTKIFGGTGWNVGISVQQTSDAGFIVGGGTDNGAYLIKTNANGDTLWTKTLAGGGCIVQQTSDGSFIVLGDKLVKTNANGDTLWTKPYSGYSVQQTNDFGYIITGGVDVVYLIKTDGNGNITSINKDFIQQNNQVNIFPNPFSTSATISIKTQVRSQNTEFVIYDLLGQKVKTLLVSSPQITFDRDNLVSGIYFFKVISDNEVIGTGKFIIEQ